MTTKSLAIRALVLAVVCAVSSSALAHDPDHHDWRHHHRHHHYRHHHEGPRSERYVPAGGDIIDFLFGGPRYYDHPLFTSGAGACAYQRVGPDANAANDINGHYCGK